MVPFTCTSPELWVRTPVMIFSMVDLPEPLVPMIPTDCPFSTEKDTPESA